MAAWVCGYDTKVPLCISFTGSCRAEEGQRLPLTTSWNLCWMLGFLNSSCLFFLGAFVFFVFFSWQRMTSLYIPGSSCPPVCYTLSPNSEVDESYISGLGILVNLNIWTKRHPLKLLTWVKDCSLKLSQNTFIERLERIKFLVKDSSNWTERHCLLLNEYEEQHEGRVGRCSEMLPVGLMILVNIFSWVEQKG